MLPAGLTQMGVAADDSLPERGLRGIGPESGNFPDAGFEMCGWNVGIGKANGDEGGR